MVAWLPWQPHLHLSNSIVLSYLNFILGMKVSWDNSD